MIDAVALDLEGTLISNVMSQHPRPHLYEFMEYCRDASFQVVLFTAADFGAARDILIDLERKGFIPFGMGMMPMVSWIKEIRGVYNPKNLQYVQYMYPFSKLHQIYLVDDVEFFVALGQQDQWIPIEQFATPYPSDDMELLRIRSILEDIHAGDTSVTRRGWNH